MDSRGNKASEPFEMNDQQGEIEVQNHESGKAQFYKTQSPDELKNSVQSLIPRESNKFSRNKEINYVKRNPKTDKFMQGVKHKEDNRNKVCMIFIIMY